MAKQVADRKERADKRNMEQLRKLLDWRLSPIGASVYEIRKESQHYGCFIERPWGGDTGCDYTKIDIRLNCYGEISHIAARRDTQFSMDVLGVIASTKGVGASFAGDYAEGERIAKGCSVSDLACKIAVGNAVFQKQINKLCVLANHHGMSVTPGSSQESRQELAFGMDGTAGRAVIDVYYKGSGAISSIKIKRRGVSRELYSALSKTLRMMGVRTL